MVEPENKESIYCHFSKIYQYIGGNYMIGFGDSVIRLIIALILGGIVGYERQAQSKAAGLRTHVLVSLGSCLCMLVSINIAMDNYFLYGLTNSDPERIAAQVITGVGFLGAGTIMANPKERSVRGLTTAASIWAVAAIGLVVGAGYLAVATVATGLVFVVLRLFVRLDDFLRRTSLKKYNFHIVMRNTAEQSRRLGDYFKEQNLSVLSFQSLTEDDTKRYIELEIILTSSDSVSMEDIMSGLLALHGIVEARWQCI
jgi:putative Mg2+ transporter-C (MgtC) family protein